MIKIIYTTEVDADTLRLNLVSYPREQLEEAMEFLKEQLGKYYSYICTISVFYIINLAERL